MAETFDYGNLRSGDGNLPFSDRNQPEMETSTVDGNLPCRKAPSDTKKQPLCVSIYIYVKYQTKYQ